MLFSASLRASCGNTEVCFLVSDISCNPDGVRMPKLCKLVSCSFMKVSLQSDAVCASLQQLTLLNSAERTCTLLLQ
eukprot:153556-Pelagomonas_calceolata.AAC.1